MNRFHTVREAKEYLISRILAQADRDGVPLADVERKMLYFSETGYSLSDMMSISREFDQRYDQDEYEKKIGQIILRMHDQHKNNRDDLWNAAVGRLRTEDHYLLVLIDNARRTPVKGTRGDFVRGMLAVVVAVALMFPLISFVHSHIDNPTAAKLVGQGAFLALILLVIYLANRSRCGSA